MRARLRAPVSALALAAWLGPHAASAAPPAASTPTPLVESLSGEARREYDAGRLLYDDGDAQGALVKFRHSYDLSHDPRLLWNMAVCEKALRHYYNTQTLIERYLATGNALLTPASRAQAEEALVTLRSLIGSLRLEVRIAGASVRVDGAPLVDPPARVPLDLGRHEVHVEKDGYAPVDRAFEIAGGAELRLVIVLVPVERKARLGVNASEGDAIAVDGSPAGTGHWEGMLSPGVHAVRVSGIGKTPFVQSVDLTPDSVRTVDVRLRDEHGPVWPWVLGAVALAAGAGVGGYFLFRPSPTPASQTPGSLGRVDLPLRLP